MPTKPTNGISLRKQHLSIVKAHFDRNQAAINAAIAVGKEYQEQTLALLRTLYRANAEVKQGIDAQLAKDIHPDYKNAVILEWAVKFAQYKGHRVDFKDLPRVQARKAVVFIQTLSV